MEIEDCMESCFRWLDRNISPHVLRSFFLAPRWAAQYHMVGIGTMIRLKFLGNRNRLYQAFLEHGYFNRDDMVRTLLYLYHRRGRRT